MVDTADAHPFLGRDGPADSDRSPADDATTTRLCLRCRNSFASTWAGERICSRCKGTSAWRMGTPPHSHPVNRRG
ncbi:MAG: hypothetical protein RLO50_08530 [Azospirillaceae bacterium]